MAEPVDAVVDNPVDSQDGAAINPVVADPPEKPDDSEAMTVDAENSKSEPTEKEVKPDEATEETPAVEPSEDVDAVSDKHNTSKRPSCQSSYACVLNSLVDFSFSHFVCYVFVGIGGDEETLARNGAGDHGTTSQR